MFVSTSSSFLERSRRWNVRRHREFAICMRKLHFACARKVGKNSQIQKAFNNLRSLNHINVRMAFTRVQAAFWLTKGRFFILYWFHSQDLYQGGGLSQIRLVKPGYVSGSQERSPYCGVLDVGLREHTWAEPHEPRWEHSLSA